MATETANKDDLAQVRTLLAAERTYAAWIRTGLAGIGGGLAVIKLLFFKLPAHQSIAHLTGQLLIMGGGTIFIFAYWNFNRTCRALGSNHTALPRFSNSILILMTAALVIISLLVFWLTV